jgi:hypothetical protein
MCTVSVIAVAGGYRLVTNRDVGRDRLLAEYPHNWGERAIGPIDPRGGGTWVAARPGQTLCLLNVNPEDPPAEPPEPVSRGLVIPALIDHADAPAAVDALDGLGLARFVPFRLVAVDRAGGRVRIVEGRWDGAALTRREHGGPPAVFVSSGLGDDRVAERVPLFEEMVAADPTPAAQDAFHRHRWPGREPVSVLMARAAARTVSITAVDDTAAGLSMRYQPVDGSGVPAPARAAAVSAGG